MKHSPIDLIIDPVSGAPAWGKIDPHRPSKAAFALKAAQGLLSGQVTIGGIEQSIIGAANKLLRRRGSRKIVSSMKQVQTEVNGTAYMWFQEIKRVSRSNEALHALVRHDGAGLTAHYRAIGPTQIQPGHANYTRGQSVSGLLTSEGEQAQSRLMGAADALARAISVTSVGKLQECEKAKLDDVLTRLGHFLANDKNA